MPESEAGDAVGAVLSELKAIRGRFGGLSRTPHARVTGLATTAAAQAGHGLTQQPFWRRDVASLIDGAITRIFDESVAAALKTLLGTAPHASGSTSDRRAHAASTAGYTPSYFGRHIEPRLLEELATALVDAQGGVADTTPARRTLEQLMADAAMVSDQRLVQQAISCGFAPLLRLAHYPEEIREDFSYRCHMEAQVSDFLPIYRVRGDYGSVRWVPAPLALVVICRSLPALRQWFDQANVLSAEFSPLPESAWSAAVRAKSVSSRLIVDGHYATTLSSSSAPDALVFKFDTSNWAGSKRRVEVRNRYQHLRTYRELTVRLRNHFCFGSFEAELTVDDPELVDLAVYDYIAGVDENDVRLYGRSGSAAESTPRSGVDGGHARIQAGPSAVIWPGSGVHFSWH